MLAMIFAWAIWKRVSYLKVPVFFATLWGSWSWMQGLHPPNAAATFTPPKNEKLLSVGFANLGITTAPSLDTQDPLATWFHLEPLDIFGVVECHPDRVNQIQSWREWHTVHAEPDARGANGIAIFSMFPIDSVQISRTPNARLDHLTAIIKGPQGTLQVEVTHPCPPIPGLLHQRKSEFDHLEKAARSAEFPMLVLGDLNETPFGTAWQELLTKSELVAAQPLSVATWPSQLKGVPIPQWLGIRIDHILVSADLGFTPVEVGPRMASDHRAIKTKIWRHAQ